MKDTDELTPAQRKAAAKTDAALAAVGIGNRQPEGTSDTPRPPKVWCAVRIQDYRLSFLSVEEEWEDYSESTYVGDDREAIYQAARRQHGLLMSANGLPSVRQLTAFRDRVRAIVDAS